MKEMKLVYGSYGSEIRVVVTALEVNWYYCNESQISCNNHIQNARSGCLSIEGFFVRGSIDRAWLSIESQRIEGCWSCRDR